MAKKEEPKQPTEQELLEAKVDAMMAVDREKAKKLETTKPVSKPIAEQPIDPSSLPPLDIFSDPKTAPEVPKDLLQHLEAKKVATENSEETTAVPVPVTLDDPATDAAVDDIEAQETEETQEGEATEQQEITAQPDTQEPHKLHHHPIFWTLVFLTALIAIVLAYLLITGGNVHLPGVMQRWIDTVQQ